MSKIEKYNHYRDIQFTTTKLSVKEFLFQGTLRDTRVKLGLLKHKTIIHQMAVNLWIDDLMIVKKAEFVTYRAPYSECFLHGSDSQKLVGLSIEKGFTQKVIEYYGGVCGCSHVLTILMQMAPAFRQGYVFTHRFPKEDSELTSEKLLPTVKRMAEQVRDTCRVWKSGSNVHQDLEMGNVRDLPNRLYPSFVRRILRFK